MAEFAYRAADARGRVCTGVMRAPDEATLEQLLRDAGYWLVSCRPRADRGQEDAGRIRLKRRDLIDLTMGLAPMLRAGVPLVEALDEMQASAGTPHMRRVVEEMARNLRAGGTISETMDAHPKAFPPYFRELVRAGEASGNLAEAFAELRRHLEWVDRLSGQVRQASIYPVMVLVVVSLFIVLLFSFVVPRFAKLLSGLGIPLPGPTRAVMAIGAFMHDWWWAILLIPAAAWLLLRLCRSRLPRVQLWLDRLRLSVPVLGEIQRMLALSRFTRHFSTLLQAGIPLLDILDMMPGLLGNAEVARAVTAVRLDVSEGASLTDALSRHKVFPPMVLRMATTGENSGCLDATMASVADYYDEEIPRRIKRLFSIIEPAIVLVLVGVVGMVALALFMPMLSLMGAVG